MLRCAVPLLFVSVLLCQGGIQSDKLEEVSAQPTSFEKTIAPQELRRLHPHTTTFHTHTTTTTTTTTITTTTTQLTTTTYHNASAAGGSTDDEEGDETHVENEGEEEVVEEEDYVYVPFFYFLLCLLLGIVTYQILEKTCIPVPYTVAIFLEGLAVGSLHFSAFDMGQLSDSIEMWTKLDADLLLVVFLPPLIFGDTFKCSWKIFKTALPQCMTLAFPGIAIGSFVGMGLFYTILPYDWDLSTSLCFASILGATDPVAVVGLLGSLGCSEALQMQIAGESLLNDGSAMVIFYIALDLMSGEEYDAGGVIELFVRLALGGVAFGFFLGLVVTLVMYLCSRKESEVDGKTQIILTVATAYGAFYLATHGACHVSEVLATVTASIVIARSAWPLIVEKEGVIMVWEIFCYVAETMIFFLAGTIMSEIFESGDYIPTAADWGWMFVVYLIAAFIRLAMLGVLYPILMSCGYGTNWKDMLVMWWGGLRGAVGLALALTVMRTSETDTKTGRLIVFHVGGTAMLTLVLNATTCGKLVQVLGLARKNIAHTLTMKQFEIKMNTHMIAEFQKVRSTPRFHLANGEKVKEIIEALKEVDLDAKPVQDIDSRQVLFQGEDKQEQVIDLDAEKVQEDMLISARKMYYKLLRHQYWHMIDDDLLPPEASSSTVLLESVDAVSPLQTMCDFDALVQHISVGNTAGYGFIAAMLQGWRNLMDGTGIGRRVVPLTRGFTKFDAYGILCCMDAHEKARKALIDLDFEPTDEMYRAQYEVINESMQETEHIKTFLVNNKVDEEIIRVCRTKMLVLYLLKKREKYVKSLVNKGVLCVADMEGLLENSEEEMRKALELQPSSPRSGDRMNVQLSDGSIRRRSSHVSHGKHSLQGYGKAN